MNLEAVEYEGKVRYEARAEAKLLNIDATARVNKTTGKTYYLGTVETVAPNGQLITATAIIPEGNYDYGMESGVKYVGRWSTVMNEDGSVKLHEDGSPEMILQLSHLRPTERQSASKMGFVLPVSAGKLSITE